ncbi:MAG: PA14 domain-containing protein [Candidatus Omnitrophica bacterium]|nr:PA14 domain-containing protein [Candidatus Omnitrophota bacterium]MDD5310749.1 PA14 domain-containing protein [Candidatus Omnitrophota bacterium]MDD5545568.1 PA14 domain-containing protein [Candidatus Omnitrophota bacterium]
MKETSPKYKKKRGVALIISVGILALIAMIATSFAINMQIEYRAAANFMYYTVAKELSGAGLDKTIADIRALAANNSYDDVMTTINASPYADPGTEVNLAEGSYQVYVEREDQKININALDETDYPWIDELKSKGLSYDDIAKIINYRVPETEYSSITSVLTATGPQSCNSGTIQKHGPYATVEELRLVLNDDVKYNAIKDFVTVYAPVIPGGLTGKYYSQPDNTVWDKNSILGLGNFCGKVVEFRALKEAKDSGSDPWPPSGTFPGADGDWNGWSEAHDAEFAGGYIAADWTWRSGLDYFGAVFTGYIYIPQDKVNQDITFKMRSENGCRLFIDGTKLIEDWTDRNMGGWPSDNVLVAPVVVFSRAGWHSIRVEYYNKENQNTVQLKWDAYGSDDYVPAEYFGYNPSSFYGDIAVDSNPVTTPKTYRAASRLGTDYNSAGILKIVSTGKTKKNGVVVAEKKTASVIQVFNTLTQSTRAEFWAPWFSLYNNFSDGEVRNVTWLDSCPTSQDGFDGSKMNWEGNYTTTPDSVKLGYWDNFNDDIAYTAIILKGGYVTKLFGIAWWDWDVHTFPSTHEHWLPRGRIDGEDATAINWDGDYVWPCTFGDFSVPEGFKEDGINGTYCLRMDVPGYYYDGCRAEERQAELNSYYYKADSPLGYDIFARSYVYDNGQKQTWDSNWQRPPSQRLANPGYASHIPSFLTGYLILKTDPPYTTDHQTKPGDVYYTFVQNGTDWFGSSDSDASVIYCPGKTDSTVGACYSWNEDTQQTQYYILAAIGVGTTYKAYYSYTTQDGSGWVTTGASGTGSASKAGVVAFRANNIYYVDLDLFWQGDPPYTNEVFVDMVYDRTDGITDNNPRYIGSTSECVTDFDNVRVIYPKGYIVSAPLIAKPPSDNANIIWDTITWNDANPNPANTSITMYARAADTPSASDDFSTEYSKGDSLSSLSGGKFQYKALLGTTALNPNDYSASSSTPVLKGVTVMYHRPKARVFYQQ